MVGSFSLSGSTDDCTVPSARYCARTIARTSLREGWEPDPDVPASHNDFFPLLCLRRRLG